MSSEEMKRSTDRIQDVVENGWKDNAPESEDAEALLAEAAVAVNNELRDHPGFTDEQRKILQSALDEVKATGISKLSDGMRTVEYLNQVGGAENFIKYLMLDAAAEAVDSPEFMASIFSNGTMMFFHVSGWEQFTDPEIWAQSKRIKQMRSNRE